MGGRPVSAVVDDVTPVCRVAHRWNVTGAEVYVCRMGSGLTCTVVSTGSGE